MLIRRGRMQNISVNNEHGNNTGRYQYLQDNFNKYTSVITVKTVWIIS